MIYTIELAEETAARLRADAQARGVAEADLLRRAVERVYAPDAPPLPQRLADLAGFDAARRLAREAGGDLRSGGETLLDQRRADGAARDVRLRESGDGA